MVMNYDKRDSETIFPKKKRMSYDERLPVYKCTHTYLHTYEDTSYNPAISHHIKLIKSPK